MKRLDRRRLSMKLIRMNILTSSTALLLACGAFMVYELVTFRATMVRNLSVHAQIIADNVASALAFNDPQAATETLSAFKAEPNIVSIRIINNPGEVFAKYQRAEGVELPAGRLEDLGSSGHRFSQNRLELFRPILLENVPIGMVYLQSDLKKLEARARRYALIVLCVFPLSLLLGLAFGSRLQKRILGSILELVQKARIVSTERDYSVRVAQTSNDELGLLARTFNEMLGQIEQRDLALRSAHDELERRVQERTAELQLEIGQRKGLEEKLRDQNEELEKQNQQIQAADRLKSEFLANMSHELRTPLNAIIGFSQVMVDGKVGAMSETHREYLGDILVSSRHLLQLINDVLDLSKIEAGKMEFNTESVNLLTLVSEIRDILREMASKNRIWITTEVDPKVAQVTIDPAKLKQVLYNYLSNALKFTPQEGRVTIRVRAEGPDHFRLEVEDTGIGIREQDLSRLFIEFQQLNSGSAKKYAGTGLGLSLTKKIVEAQGGRCGVQSTFGQGSTFFVVLPRVAVTHSIPEPGPANIVRSTGGPTILVIEDDRADQSWMVRVLKEGGYQVVTAATCADAEARSRERTFDGITLDLLLPDGSGWDFLRAIRREGKNRNTPVVIATVVAEKGIAAGRAVDDFLVKPLPAEQLLESLRRVADERNGRHSVLVVDDDPISLEIMAHKLKEAGFGSICALDSRRGLEVALQQHPAAIVLDLLMPGMDGFEFLARLRQSEEGRAIPVIIWTSRDLTVAEKARLATIVQAIFLKGQAGPDALLGALRAHLSDVSKHRVAG